MQIERNRTRERERERERQRKRERQTELPREKESGRMIHFKNSPFITCVLVVSHALYFDGQFEI